MNRTFLTALILLGAVGFGFHARADREGVPHSKGDITALQQKRIALLVERAGPAHGL